MTLLHSSDGTQYLVDNKLAEGGEGIIVSLEGRNDLVAKLYKPNLRTEEREAKLQAMIATPPHDEVRKKFNHPSICWPIATVKEDAGNFIGFIMPRIYDSVILINAYNIKSKNFLQFNWQEQHQVAKNLCAAFNALHAQGYVIGDVNERNILVNKHGLVTLIDTDSFQVRQNNRIFYCPVAVPEYTPVELHGKNLSQETREFHHDNFGLAILIFKLLMHGQHPFSGALRDLNISVGKVDEHCIRSGIFPWFDHPQFTKPPNAKELDVLHFGLQQLFDHAFVIGHSMPTMRPTSLTWYKALHVAQSKLIKCTTNRHYIQSGRICLDCSIIPIIAPVTTSTPLVLSPPPTLTNNYKMVSWLLWIIIILIVGWIISYESSIREANIQLYNKQTLLDKANTKLATKQTLLNESNTQLYNKQTLLDKTNTKLATKQTLLNEFNTQLDNKQSLLDKANTKLAIKQTLLNEANAQLATKQTLLDKANAQLDNKQSLLDKANAQLDNKQSLLDKANTQLATKQTLLDEANSKLPSEQITFQHTRDKLVIYELAFSKIKKMLLKQAILAFNNKGRDGAEPIIQVIATFDLELAINFCQDQRQHYLNVSKRRNTHVKAIQKALVSAQEWESMIPSSYSQW